MPPEIQDVRLFLQAELVRRCKSNPKYSLRAFAKYLDVEPSALAKILNGKRSVSQKMLDRLHRRLDIAPDKWESFVSQLSERRGRSKNTSPAAAEPAYDYRQITVDHFHVISDWYHYAILELTAIEGFQPNVKWISKTLGISVNEARAAIERLIRLGFLEVTENGEMIDCAGDATNIKPGYSSGALRKMQRQILIKALEALEEVPLELRDNTGMTMAISRDLIPEAKKKISRFRRELCAFMQAGKKRDAVYNLGIALYPITKEPGAPKESKRRNKP